MRTFRVFLMAAILSASATSFACEAHYRVYDPYRGDYHHWDHDEDAHYHTWVVETHHDSRDYKHLNKDEQGKYWQWRHDHH